MDPRNSSSQPVSSADTGVGAVGRAPDLLVSAHVPLRDLLLDPGDELSLAVDPSTTADAAFVRAFAPVRSYQRLVATGLDGLMSLIARRPATLAGRILVRPDAAPDEAPGDVNTRYVVIDGSRHVAALRRLAEIGPVDGAELPEDLTALFDECPVVVVHPGANPALVLALLRDAMEPEADDWLKGQRDRLLRLLSEDGAHHSQPTIAATGANTQTLRRYHAYLALQQLMQSRPVPLPTAVALYPLFHAAVGRPVIRTWLDWDDTLCRFIDDAELEHFYRLLTPSALADGTTRPPCITAVEDVVQLCDVLGEPVARRALLDEGQTLEAAAEVINAGAFQQWSTQIGEAFETMQWDRRRFRPRS